MGRVGDSCLGPPDWPGMASLMAPGSDQAAIAVVSQGLSAQNPGLTTPARLGDTPKVALNFLSLTLLSLAGAWQANPPNDVRTLAAALRDGTAQRMPQKRGPKPRTKSDEALWRAIATYRKHIDAGKSSQLCRVASQVFPGGRPVGTVKAYAACFSGSIFAT